MTLYHVLPELLQAEQTHRHVNKAALLPGIGQAAILCASYTQSM